MTNQSEWFSSKIYVRGILDHGGVLCVSGSSWWGRERGTWYRGARRGGQGGGGAALGWGAGLGRWAGALGEGRQ
jgi:hypothetical protein